MEATSYNSPIAQACHTKLLLLIDLDSFLKLQRTQDFFQKLVPGHTRLRYEELSREVAVLNRTLPIKISLIEITIAHSLC